MSILSQGKAYLNFCYIGGVLNSVISDGTLIANFAVKSIYVYEDICKPYFTATMVIENFLNVTELFLAPTVPVFISFVAPNDIGVSVVYEEGFSILEYSTKIVDIGAQGRSETTIQLVGLEYYKDHNNVVIRNFKNQIGTAAAREIHDSFISVNGSMSIPVPSKGMIGLDDRAHEVDRLHPFTAIRNILTRCVFAQYPTCAPVYYRNKQGYKIAPLQYLLEAQSPVQLFEERPAAGTDFLANVVKYNEILELKQEMPRNRHASKLSDSLQSFDIKGGLFFPNTSGKIAAQSLLKTATKSKEILKELNSFLSTVGQSKSGQSIFGIINKHLQKLEVTKDGPGQYIIQQAGFLAAVGYSPMYTILVPLQTGGKVTCGNKIEIVYPINDQLTRRKLFVPRLVHKLEMVKTSSNLPGYQQERETQSYAGTTELTALYWKN